MKFTKKQLYAYYFVAQRNEKSSKSNLSNVVIETYSIKGLRNNYMYIKHTPCTQSTNSFTFIPTLIHIHYHTNEPFKIQTLFISASWKKTNFKS